MVEDQESDARLMVDALRKAGLDLEAIRVESEVEFVAGLAADPDIVLCDYSLPGFDALRALEALQQSGAQAPMIIVSGSIGEETAVELIRRGASDYILKDRLGRLGGAVRQAIEQRRLREAEARARAEVRMTEELNRQILDTASDPFLAVSLEGRIIMWNRRAETVFGWSKREAQGRLLTDTIIPERYRPVYAASIESLAQTGQDRSLHSRKDLTALRRDGVEIPVELRTWITTVGGRQTFCAFLRDMSESRALEDGLSRARKRLQHVVASSPAVLYTLDLDQGGLRLTWVSDNVSDLIGTSDLTLDLGWWLGRIHPEDLQPLISQVEDELFRTDRVVSDYRVRRQSGGYLWVRDEKRLIRDDSGSPVEAVGSWVDITNRVRAEEVLRETNARLEAALDELQRAQSKIVEQERLRALGEMASGIAHDFNNALAPILGFSELLLDQPDRLDDRERTLKFLKMMHTAASDATSVVRRLREFYRPRTATDVMQPVDVNEVLAQSLELSRPRWKPQAESRGAPVEAELSPGELPRVLGDPAHLREAVVNLIFNAVDAMPSGGRLVVRSFQDEQGLAVLEVQDTGGGMTEEVRHRCLQPFFTTKGEKGTGLGLPMVYGIVQRHSGTLEIESAPGQGATVRIRLPAFSGRQPVVEGLGPSKARSMLRVLVVDDERSVREVTTVLLETDGHEVVSVADGDSALRACRDARFDVVITDRAMPGMNGDRLALALRALSPEMPIIMLTGFGDLMDATDELPGGVSLILGKPLSRNSLRSGLQAVALLPRQSAPVTSSS